MKSQVHNEGELKELTVKIEKDVVVLCDSLIQYPSTRSFLHTVNQSIEQTAPQILVAYLVTNKPFPSEDHGRLTAANEGVLLEVYIFADTCFAWATLNDCGDYIIRLYRPDIYSVNLAKSVENTVDTITVGNARLVLNSRNKSDQDNIRNFSMKLLSFTGSQNKVIRQRGNTPTIDDVLRTIGNLQKDRTMD